MKKTLIALLVTALAAGTANAKIEIGSTNGVKFYMAGSTALNAYYKHVTDKEFDLKNKVFNLTLGATQQYNDQFNVTGEIKLKLDAGKDVEISKTKVSLSSKVFGDLIFGKGSFGDGEPSAGSATGASAAEDLLNTDIADNLAPSIAGSKNAVAFSYKAPTIGNFVVFTGYAHDTIAKAVTKQTKLNAAGTDQELTTTTSDNSTKFLKAGVGYSTAISDDLSYVAKLSVNTVKTVKTNITTALGDAAAAAATPATDIIRTKTVEFAQDLTSKEYGTTVSVIYSNQTSTADSPAAKTSKLRTITVGADTKVSDTPVNVYGSFSNQKYITDTTPSEADKAGNDEFKINTFTLGTSYKFNDNFKVYLEGAANVAKVIEKRTKDNKVVPISDTLKSKVLAVGLKINF